LPDTLDYNLSAPKNLSARLYTTPALPLPSILSKSTISSSRVQRLLPPGLASTAHPDCKSRCICVCNSNQNQFCQAMNGLRDRRLNPPDCSTHPGGFVTSQPGVIGRLPGNGCDSSCF
jgi:hypothetical protein